jgi:hypothetical protein
VFLLGTDTNLCAVKWLRMLGTGFYANEFHSRDKLLLSKMYAKQCHNSEHKTSDLPLWVYSYIGDI